MVAWWRGGVVRGDVEVVGGNVRGGWWCAWCGGVVAWWCGGVVLLVVWICGAHVLRMRSSMRAKREVTSTPFRERHRFRAARDHLCMCMCMYVCACACACMCVHVHVHVCVCMCMCMYVCACPCACPLRVRGGLVRGGLVRGAVVASTLATASDTGIRYRQRTCCHGRRRTRRNLVRNLQSAC